MIFVRFRLIKWAGQRQPLYANAPPKPRRLNTSREYCSSPDRSPERSSDSVVDLIADTPADLSSPAPATGEMYGSNYYRQQQQQQQHHQHHQSFEKNGWPRRRPVSAEVSSMMMASATAGAATATAAPTSRHSPAVQQQQQQQNAERRTPDAYGRFKADYEDVYNNGGSSSQSQSSQSSCNRNNRNNNTDLHLHLSSNSSQRYANANAADYPNRSELARRVPARPHSADFLATCSSEESSLGFSAPSAAKKKTGRQSTADYWSEENYAQQVRQSSVLRTYPHRERVSPLDSPSTPVGTAAQIAVAREEDISRDVKESALWSYVKQSTPVGFAPATLHLNDRRRPPVKRILMSNSQENLVDHHQFGERLVDDHLPAIFHPAASAAAAAAAAAATAAAANYFSRSASARLPRLQASDRELLNTSQTSTDSQPRDVHDLKKIEQVRLVHLPLALEIERDSERERIQGVRNS